MHLSAEKSAPSHRRGHHRAMWAVAEKDVDRLERGVDVDAEGELFGGIGGRVCPDTRQPASVLRDTVVSQRTFVGKVAVVIEVETDSAVALIPENND